MTAEMTMPAAAVASARRCSGSLRIQAALENAKSVLSEMPSSGCAESIPPARYAWHAGMLEGALIGLVLAVSEAEPGIV